jgi:hypothetical protein
MVDGHPQTKTETSPQEKNSQVTSTGGTMKTKVFIFKRLRENNLEILGYAQSIDRAKQEIEGEGMEGKPLRWQRQLPPEDEGSHEDNVCAFVTCRSHCISGYVRYSIDPVEVLI